jgi:hypothetical protein
MMVGGRSTGKGKNRRANVAGGTWLTRDCGKPTPRPVGEASEMECRLLAALFGPHQCPFRARSGRSITAHSAKTLVTSSVALPSALMAWIS